MVNLEMINELWLQIDKLHLSYLQTEESPDRIEQKKKLEGYMKEYLCLVTSNQRFYSVTTKVVLYSSLMRKNEQFSPGKFSNAFEMLGTYAANLLGQPWRKEFKEIRMYSGCYKYQIEQQLIGAEEILMEMGYTLDLEFNRLIVQGMLDYDRIVRCHRDCLLAKVESNILAEIHAALNVSMRPCSWTTIFDYRDTYVGSVAHCVRGLMYQQAQKENMAAYNAPAPLSPYMPLSNIGPHEMYPTNFPYQLTYQPVAKTNYISYPYPSDNRGMYLPKTLPMEERDFPLNYQTTQAAEMKSLDKHVPESFEVWNKSANREVKSVPKFDSLLDIDRLEQLCYDDVDNNRTSSSEKPLTKESLNKKQEKALPAPLPLPRSPDRKNTIDKSRNNLSNQTLVKPQTTIATVGGTRPKETNQTNGFASKNQSAMMNNWECLFCTYFNPEGREICDMCAKSRSRGPESKPLFRGGRECSNCTLVNPPEENQCAACSTSLTHAPTYI